MIKLQSAMEYLMTYGWSVVIIGVVLVVIFSFGVFGNGSVSATSSCLGQTGYLCSKPILNSSGILNITFGQSSGSAYNITGVGCTNQTGIPTFLDLPTAILLTRGSTTKLDFECPLANKQVGSVFTGTVWIQYNTGSSSVFEAKVATVDAKVTTSTSIPGGGGLVALLSVPITLSNTRTSATPAPFQQMLTINSNNYAPYINGNWMNVEFTTGNMTAGTPGSVLQAWVESSPSGSSTSTVVWVNIPTGISASSNDIIYMDMMQGNVMSSSGPTGEAPQLSTNYAQYDNGGSVFSVYDDFKGPLAAYWSTAGSAAGTTITASNGLVMTFPTGTGAGIVSASSYSANFVIDDDMSAGILGCNAGMLFGAASSNTATFNGQNFYQYDMLNYRGSTYQQIYLWNGASWNQQAQGTTVYSINTPYILTQYVTTGNLNGYINYNQVYSYSSTLNLNPQYIGVIGSSDNSGCTPSGSTSTDDVYWFRTRAYPPAAVMPSTTYGAV